MGWIKSVKNKIFRDIEAKLVPIEKCRYRGGKHELPRTQGDIGMGKVAASWKPCGEGMTCLSDRRGVLSEALGEVCKAHLFPCVGGKIA